LVPSGSQNPSSSKTRARDPPVCQQKDGFLEIVMQGSQQRQSDRTRQSQTAQVAANEIAFPDPV
jgi:hypothetical protein